MSEVAPPKSIRALSGNNLEEQGNYRDGMTTDVERCLAAVELTTSELLMLGALPMPVFALEHRTSCELDRGHPGPHVVLGQAAQEDEEWWLRWDADHRELTMLPFCPARWIENDEQEACTLPVGHWGSHR